MNSIPMNLDIWAPLALANDEDRPKELARVTLSELCEAAEIPLRVTGSVENTIVLHETEEHFSAPAFYYVGVGLKIWTVSPERALRVLEVLAHGFHDYASRETVCGRGFFTVPSKRGRPRLHGHVMSAKERMRKMRLARENS